MLSLLLPLLKIVGILILILLGLLLLTVLALIFAPFRYELEAKCTSIKELEVKGRFSWLLRLVSVRGFYRNREMSVWLRILGIPVFRLPETEERRRKNKRKQKKRAEKERRSREKEWEKEKKALEIGEISGEKKTIGERKPDGPVIRESGNQETQIPGRTQGGEMPGEPDSPVKEPDPRPEGQAAQPDRDSEFQKEDKTQTEKKEKKERKKKRFGRKKKKEPEDAGTGGSGWRDKLEEGLNFIQDPDNRKMFAFLKKLVFAVIHHILPGRFEIEARIGLEDPAATGTVLALVYMLYPFYGDHIRVVGEFEEVVLEGRLYLRGRIRILTLLIIGFKIYRNKTVRGLLNRRKKDGR